MSLSAAALRKMVEMGLTLEQAAELAEVMEGDTAARAPSVGAVRTRRYRERLEATGMTSTEWRAVSARIVARDGGICQYCETTKGRMHCDHVVPLAQGGDSSDDNLVCACQVCNSGKAGLTLEEWRGAEWATTWRNHRVMSRDVTDEIFAPLSLAPSPQTPQPHTHSPPDITTRAKRPFRRAPEDWSPSEKTLTTLTSEGYSAGDLERALTRMRDHEFAKARSDWDATFRNWVRNDADRRPRLIHERPDHPKPKTDREDRIRRMLAGAVAAADG